MAVDSKKNILKELLEGNPYLKGAYKKAEELGGLDFEQAYQVGGPEVVNQELLNQLTQLSKTKVTKEGTTTGILPALLSTVQGNPVSPLAPRQEELGINPALSLMRMGQEQKQEERMGRQEQRRDEQLDLYTKMEDRRLRQEKIKNLQYTGGVFKENELEKFANEGADFNAIIEAYGIPSRVDSKTGERSWLIPSKEILDNKASQQRVAPAEITYLSDVYDAVDTTQEIMDDLASLGIQDPSKFGKIEIPEGFFDKMGPLSLSAKFNLFGQYAQDPKYTALKTKIERSFQKFRKIVTGAQASYQELKLLRPLMESLQQRPGVFFAITNDLVNEGNRMAENRLNTMQSAGRDVSELRQQLEERKPKSGSKQTISPQSSSGVEQQLRAQGITGTIKAIRLKKKGK